MKSLKTLANLLSEGSMDVLSSKQADMIKGGKGHSHKHHSHKSSCSTKKHSSSSSNCAGGPPPPTPRP